MTYKDILPYCLFFKGEELMPSYLSQTDARLWLAEKKVCEEFPFLISYENPRTSLAAAVYSFLGKWYPFQFGDYINRYFEKAPELKDSLQLV